MMLSNPIDEKKDFQILNHEDFVAEWKWDGIRVQIIISNDNVVLFSRNGDDITKSFPDIRFFSQKNVVIGCGVCIISLKLVGAMETST